MASKKNPGTVRVRVAVVVDAHGSWGAAGRSGANDEAAVNAAVENISTNGVEALRFVEADVPLPDVPTICVT